MKLPALLAVVLVCCTVGCTAKPVTGSADSGPSGQPSAASSSGPDSATATQSSTDPAGTDSADSVTSTPASSQPAATRSTRPPSVAPRSTVPGYSMPTTGLASCSLPYLRIRFSSGGAGASHAGYLLTFTNTGQIACTMQGYPVVWILDGKGHRVRQAAATPAGYLGGYRRSTRPFPTVVVGAGQPASALVEGVVIGPTGAACPAEPALLVTAPHSSTSARVTGTTRICGQVQIHPVVAGGTGSG